MPRTKLEKLSRHLRQLLCEREGDEDSLSVNRPMTLEDALKHTNRVLAEVDYDLARVPEWMRTLHLISTLDFEIANGGVDQWLANSSGDKAAETVEALIKIGAMNTAQIVQQILDTFPDGTPPKDNRERNVVLQRLRLALGGQWRTLGEHLLKWPDDIDRLLRRYVDTETRAADERN